MLYCSDKIIKKINLPQGSRLLMMKYGLKPTPLFGFLEMKSTRKEERILGLRITPTTIHKRQVEFGEGLRLK